jgi:hypothetical protein
MKLSKTLRFYLWPDSGPKRMPMVCMESKSLYPQYAGQRLRFVEVSYCLAGDMLHYHAMGHFGAFDSDGRFDIEPQAKRAAIDMTRSAMDADGERRRKTPNLDVIRRASKYKMAYDAAHRWEPTETDLALLEADLFGKQPIPPMKRTSRQGKKQ